MQRIKRPVTRLTKRQAKEQQLAAENAARAWNARHAIGTRVRYWRKLRYGPTLDTATRSEAWVLPCGEPVVLLDRVSGAVSIHHLTPASELPAAAPPFKLGQFRGEESEVAS